MAINKYSALSVQQQYKIGQKLVELADFSDSALILDIGCGTGELSSLLAERVGKGFVLAIDPDKERIEYARNTHSRSNLQWELTTIENFISKDMFDFVFSNFVLHWTSDKKFALEAAYRYLKPGGQFAMTVVTHIPPINEVLFRMAGSAGTNFKNAAPLMPNEWWLTLLHEVGFEIISSSNTDGFTFSSIDEYLGWWEASSQGRYRIEMLSEKDLGELRNLYPSKVTVYDDGSLLVLAKKSV